MAELSKLAELTTLTDLIVLVHDGNFTLASLMALSKRLPDCEILAKSRGVFRGGTFDGTW